MQAPKWRKPNNRLISAGYYLREHPELLIATAIVAAGFVVSAIMLSTDPNFLKYYGDGVAHLAIARRVFDTLTPGLAQLGGVWLPMFQLLLMPFVANDFLFHMGLAGTIVSLSATAVTAVALFKILRLQFASPTVGIFGSFLYFLNPSVIYMGIAPMMEALFMMFFMLSVYYLQKWYYLSESKQNIWLQYRTLLKATLAVSAASLTRYEGWVLPLGLIFTLFFVQLFIRREKWGKIEKHRLQALLSVVLIFAFVGITSWIAWNLIIFKDPLYSLTGPYSAAAQADSRTYNEEFKLNPVATVSLIFDAAGEMYGLHVLAICFLGLSLYLYSGIKRKRLRFHILTILMIMAPILAISAAMIQGSGEIARTGDSWFNGRYLIFIAPLLAFGSSSLLNSVIEIRRTSRWKPLMITFTIVLIAGSYALTFASQTFEYGKAVALNTEGALPVSRPAQNAAETGKQLGRSYEDGNIVLFILSADLHRIMLESNLPLRNFIDSSNRQYWDISVQSPWIYGNYVVLQKQVEQTDFDPLKDVAQDWNVNKQTLLEHYNLIYENEGFEILKRK